MQLLPYAIGEAWPPATERFNCDMVRRQEEAIADCKGLPCTRTDDRVFAGSGASRSVSMTAKRYSFRLTFTSRSLHNTDQLRPAIARAGTVRCIWFSALVPLRAANGEDIALGDRAQISGPEGNQGPGLARGLHKLDLDSVASVELDHSAQIPGAETMLG